MSHGLLGLIGVHQCRSHKFVVLGHVGLQRLIRIMMMSLLRRPVCRGCLIDRDDAQRYSIVQHVCASSLPGHRLEASQVRLLPRAVLVGLLIQNPLQIIELLI